jgi:hypothetical protein
LWNEQTCFTNLHDIYKALRLSRIEEQNLYIFFCTPLLHVDKLSRISFFTMSPTYGCVHSFLDDGVEVPECPVCCEPFLSSTSKGPSDRDTELVQIKECRHFFHRECLTRWVDDEGRNTCPSCRHELFSINFNDDDVLNAVDDIGHFVAMMENRVSQFSDEEIARIRTLMPQNTMATLGALHKIATERDPSPRTSRTAPSPGLQVGYLVSDFANEDQGRHNHNEVSGAHRQSTPRTTSHANNPAHEISLNSHAHNHYTLGVYDRSSTDSLDGEEDTVRQHGQELRRPHVDSTSSTARNQAS